VLTAQQCPLAAAVPRGFHTARSVVWAKKSLPASSSEIYAGAFPDRGVVLAGAGAGFRQAGAGWEAGLRIAEEVITCRLADEPPPAGSEVVVTVLTRRFWALTEALVLHRLPNEGLIGYGGARKSRPRPSSQER
jgi:hypothetical protein